jgi:3-phosphoshikimate 1-carboxyvinyltransferase
MSFVAIQPAGEPLDAVVTVPGSKSITNRALVLAALADGTSTLHNALFSDDTRRMLEALPQLGIAVEADEAGELIRVHGCGGQIPSTETTLFCGNSGTTIRFLTALCALGYGAYELDGVARMRQRPIGELLAALRQLGAVVGSKEQEGFPPVIVRGGGLRGGEVTFTAAQSSQYISAVLMAAPYARNDVYLTVRDPVSVPYLDMTIRMMASFGVTALDRALEGELRYVVPCGQRYAAQDYVIEPDASNASYFLAAAAVAGGRVTVRGLGEGSIQGDVGFSEVLEQMGCRVERRADDLTVIGPPRGRRLRGLDVDLNAMPDMAQTLAVVALFAEGPTTIRNVANLRVKETDRLAALANELGKFGAEVEIFADGLRVRPPQRPTPARVHTYDDHRMAMSFAVAGLALDGVEILDPECVKKSFPDFFTRFAALQKRA